MSQENMYQVKKKIKVLNNVSFTINKSNFTVVLVFYGSGKSTTLNLIGVWIGLHQAQYVLVKKQYPISTIKSLHNIKGAERIIEFSKEGIKKTSHHISTINVVHDNIEDIDDFLFTEFDYDVGQVEENFYIKTKIGGE